MSFDRRSTEGRMWQVLWDWYRGDCGLLHEGETFPSTGEMETAEMWMACLDDNAIADQIGRMEADGLFRKSGTDSDDFFEWLEDIRWAE